MSGEADLVTARESLERNGETLRVWRISFREAPPVPHNDEFLLRSDDLSLLERYYDAGGGRYVMRFNAKTVSLSTSGANVIEPEQWPLSAPVVANWIAALPALPLAQGFEASAHTFDMTRRAIEWKSAVVGEEAVEAPAGTFDVYKVALTCLADDAPSSTAWVTKNPPYRIVRRESAYVPELGRGRMVIELAHIRGSAEE